MTSLQCLAFGVSLVFSTALGGFVGFVFGFNLATADKPREAAPVRKPAKYFYCAHLVNTKSKTREVAYGALTDKWGSADFDEMREEIMATMLKHKYGSKKAPKNV